MKMPSIAVEESYGREVIRLCLMIPYFALLLALHYAPNENDLKIVNLDSYVTDLLDKNNKVAIAVAAISNARIDRDKVLYKKETGLYDIAMAVKLYVRSIFGTTSPENAQVKSLSFTNRKS